MALAKCRECGRSVSDKALACPHCGAPAPVVAGKGRVARSDTGTILVALGALVVILLVAKSCSAPPAPPAARTAAGPADLSASARHVCRQFIEQRGYKVSDWGDSYAWTVVVNADGAHSVGARVVAAAPGDVQRNLYLSCVVSNSGDNWRLQSLSRLQ